MRCLKTFIDKDYKTYHKPPTIPKWNALTSQWFEVLFLKFILINQSLKLKKIKHASLIENNTLKWKKADICTKEHGCQ